MIQDEKTILDLTREAMEAMGYTALCAANGKEALDIYKSPGPGD